MTAPSLVWSWFSGGITPPSAGWCGLRGGAPLVLGEGVPDIAAPPPPPTAVGTSRPVWPSPEGDLPPPPPPPLGVKEEGLGEPWVHPAAAAAAGPGRRSLS